MLKPPLNGQLSNGVAVWLILLDKIHKNMLIAVDVVYIPQINQCLKRPDWCRICSIESIRGNLDQKSCHDEGW